MPVSDDDLDYYAGRIARRLDAILVALPEDEPKVSKSTAQVIRRTYTTKPDPEPARLSGRKLRLEVDVDGKAERPIIRVDLGNRYVVFTVDRTELSGFADEIRRLLETTDDENISN